MIKSEWVAFENHMLNEGVSKKRIQKLLAMYRVCCRGLPCNLNDAKRQDIENFINRLNRDTFLRENGACFSGSTKSDIKKFLRQYFKWLKGKGEFFPEEVRWIKSRVRKDEKPKPKDILTKKEASELAAKFYKPDYRIAILLLFDSGFRISEFLSVRKSDLTWEPVAGEDHCWWLKCRSSKTFARKIDVQLFTKQINEFCSSTYYKNLRSDDKLMSFNKANFAKLLKKAGEDVFKGRKSLSPHCLRHSSATHYSIVYNGNMIQLCQRYGWAFGSDMAKTYVRMSGAYQKQAALVTHNNEVSDLKNQIKHLNEKYEALRTLVLESTRKLVEEQQKNNYNL